MIKLSGRTALILGITGQDGSLLAKTLLEKGYEVVGLSRKSESSAFTNSNLSKLGLVDQLKILQVDPSDYATLSKSIGKYEPDEFYNLSGPSSVADSFIRPQHCLKEIVVNTLNCLESIRNLSPTTRYFDPSSSECFGNTRDGPADESTPINPRSPYGIAKVTSRNLVSMYRDSYGIFASSGILFNHESPLRAEHFVTQKIAKAAVEISNGNRAILSLGDIEIIRDWGWAPEYVEAMHLMLTYPEPGDYVIATGESFSLKKFIEIAFLKVGLDWNDHVTYSDQYQRPQEIYKSYANPGKARRLLGWKAKYSLKYVVDRMIEAHLNN